MTVSYALRWVEKCIAAHLGDLASSLEEFECWHGSNAEALSERLLLVHIDFLQNIVSLSSCSREKLTTNFAWGYWKTTSAREQSQKTRSIPDLQASRRPEQSYDKDHTIPALHEQML